MSVEEQIPIMTPTRLQLRRKQGTENIYETNEEDTSEESALLSVEKSSNDKITCRYCGAVLPNGLKYCSSCGAVLY
jgi:ribosomal protein L40E